MSSKKLVAFLLGVSLFGLLVGVMMALRITPESAIPPRKSLVGITFGIVCILGLIASIRPGPCSRAVRLGSRATSETGTSPPLGEEDCKVAHSGHHPNCSEYASHVFRVSGRVLCAGCTGLFLGGVVALAGGILYFFLDVTPWSNGQALTLVGAMGVAIGLVPVVMSSASLKPLRTAANVIFPVGGLLLLVGADQTAQNLSVDMFIVLLVPFWILTRVTLAQWDHARICATCDQVERTMRLA
jgi:hypothetical protein